MPASGAYYNEEYAALGSDYRAAGVRDQQLREEVVTTRPAKTKPKRHSKYDSQLYALPDLEDEKSPQQTLRPTTPLQQTMSSKELTSWKGFAITNAVNGTLAVATVAIFTIYFIILAPDSNGKCILRQIF